MPRGVRAPKTYEGWPKKCPGSCGKLTRPSGITKDKFPGTVPAVNLGGWCDPCRRTAQGVALRPSKARAMNSKDPAITERRIADALAWRLKFEADRRARGVPIEGILFAGEVAVKPQEDDLPTVDHNGITGKCKMGHPYDMYDVAGRRRCSKCMSANGSRGGRSTQDRMAATKEAPHGRCRRGHAFKLSGRGDRVCLPCRAADKRAWRRSKAEQEFEKRNKYGRAS